MIWSACPDLQVNMWDGSSGLFWTTYSARTGTYAFYLDDSNDWLLKNVASRADYYLRAAVYFRPNYNYIALRFKEGTTTHVEANVGLNYECAGGLVNIYRGELGTLLASSSSGVISGNRWHCIEAYASIADSGGVMQVKVDGSMVINYTGDTRNGGTGVINAIRLENEGGINNPTYIDDVVIRDDQWPGQGGLLTLAPDGDGSDTGWTPSAGNRWECVDELPFSMTDNVSTDVGVSGTKNTFSFANLPSNIGSVAFVQPVLYADLALSGTGNIRAIAKSGTTYGNGLSTALSTTPRLVEHYMTLDPDTSSAWTVSGVNALQAGAETV